MRYKANSQIKHSFFKLDSLTGSVVVWGGGGRGGLVFEQLAARLEQHVLQHGLKQPQHVGENCRSLQPGVLQSWREAR